MATDWEGGLLPAGVADSVLTTAQEESAAMSLGTTRPMATGVESIPLIEVSPEAQWLDSPGDKKAFTMVTWSSDELRAREVACITAVPDSYINDATWNVEASVETELGAAIARRVDGSILFGISSPPGFPTLVSGPPATGADALDAIDQALSEVEASGLLPTGIVSGPQILGALRQAWREAGALPDAKPGESIFGVPLRVLPTWPSGVAYDALVGAWPYLQIGVREDVLAERSRDGVITDTDGSVLVSGFETDSTLVRCHARIAAAVGTPVGPNGDPVQPFAAAKWTSDPGTAAAKAQPKKAA